MGSYFELTPQWVRFDQFWVSIKHRNLWLIKLRYGAVCMLLALIAGVEILEAFSIKTGALVSITGAILVYNVVFHRLYPKLPASDARFHGLHFALLQMCLDFAALLLIVYFTGGVEAPFYPFFLFHIIIGSLILPARVVNVLIAVTVGIALTGAILELQGIVPHQQIGGLFATGLYNNVAYIIFHFTTFTFTLLLSNYLANSISKELYKRERALNTAYKQLQEAERTKSKYVMSVVHDLKTPIAAALTYLNMIIEGTLGKVEEKFERPLERSRIRLNGAITMIGDILELSQVRLSAGFEPQKVDLYTMMEDIYQDNRILFVSKEIEFKIKKTRQEVDYIVEGEPRLLKLALGNLVSNARKYTEQGGRVEVTLKKDEKEVLVEVADNGIGIPEKELQKIFQDFYRSTITKKKGIEGTGLGVTIVSQVVEEHHGEIFVQSPSRIGNGTDRPGAAFLIRLPIRFDRNYKRPQQVEQTTG